jgi:hypothetical protein
MPTSLPMGDESAMNFEGVGVSFSEFLLFSEPYLRIGSELRRERGCPVSRDLRIRIGPPMSLTYEGAKILVRGIIGLCEFRRTPLKRSSRGEIVYPIAPVWKAHPRRAYSTAGRYYRTLMYT